MRFKRVARGGKNKLQFAATRTNKGGITRTHEKVTLRGAPRRRRRKIMVEERAVLQREKCSSRNNSLREPVGGASAGFKGNCSYNPREERGTSPSGTIVKKKVTVFAITLFTLEKGGNTPSVRGRALLTQEGNKDKRNGRIHKGTRRKEVSPSAVSRIGFQETANRPRIRGHLCIARDLGRGKSRKGYALWEINKRTKLQGKRAFLMHRRNRNKSKVEKDRDLLGDAEQKVKARG